MKKLIIFQLLLYSSWFCLGQQIPFGQSEETFIYYQNQTTSENFTIGYYKPANYDSLQSEMILYCHGQGGNQNEGYNLLNQISEQKKSIDCFSNFQYCTMEHCWYNISYEIWLPDVFKEI